MNKKDTYEYLRFAYPSLELSSTSMDTISRIIKSGWFCDGEYVASLELFFRTRYNVKYAIACANCTNGLIIAFKAAGIIRQCVAIPAFTWPSTLYALECNENIPVFVDVNKNTWCIDKTSRSLNHVDTVIAVDCFGADSGLFENKKVIYDAAHGYGLESLGSRGLVEVVSFSFTKAVTGMQGGIILTNDDNIYKEAVELTKLSAKMLEISAYLCLKSINKFEENLKYKNSIINTYRLKLKVPYKEQKVGKNWNASVYAILLKSKDKVDRVANKFLEHRIEVKRYYEPLISGLPVTDDIYSRIIALPLHSKALNRINEICEIINEA